MSTPDFLIDSNEVARRFGVPVKTVREWTRRGDLPAIRLNDRKIRYSHEAILAWLDHQPKAGT